MKAYLFAKFLACLALFSQPAVAQPTRSIERPIILNSNDISPGAKRFHKDVWVSQFKQGVRNNPDAFSDLVTRRYYGKAGQDAAARKEIQDTIIRYGKAGGGSGWSLLEEFAKDSRKWSGGIEERRQAAVQSMNRCPNCVNDFAEEAHAVLRKQKLGMPVSTEEKIFLDGLNAQIGSGVFVDVNASFKTLLERAAPNDATVWTGTALADLTSRLSSASETQFNSFLRDTKTFQSLLGASVKGLQSEVSTGFESLNTSLKTLGQTASNFKEEQAKRDAFQNRIAEVQAGVGVISGLLVASGRAEDARRLAATSDSAVTAYVAIATHLDDARKVSRLAATLTTFNSVIAIASILQGETRNAQNEYIVEMLAGLGRQITQLQASVDRIDSRLVAIVNAVELLRRDTRAQFIVLANAVKELGEDLSDLKLSLWASDRSTALDSVSILASDCRQIQNQSNTYEAASDDLKKRFRETCLLKFLQIANVNAVSQKLVDPIALLPQSDQSVRFVRASLEGRFPLELLLSHLGNAVPLTRNPSGEENKDKPKVPGSDSEPIPVRMDVQVWHKAVSEYSNARLRWSSYVPDPNRSEDIELLRLEEEARVNGESLSAWVSRRLSVERFNAAMESYRESSDSLLLSLESSIESFLKDKKDTVWCPKEKIEAMLESSNLREVWLAQSCLAYPTFVESSIDGYSAVSFLSPKSESMIAGDLLLFLDRYEESASLLSSQKPTSVGGPGLTTARTFQLGADGWFSRDETNLIYGLRSINSATYVLGRIRNNPPDVNNLDVKMDFPPRANRLQFDKCLSDRARNFPQIQLEEHVNQCIREIRTKGCSRITVKNDLFSALSYQICDPDLALNPKFIKGIYFSGMEWSQQKERFFSGATDRLDSVDRDRRKAAFSMHQFGTPTQMLKGPGLHCNQRPPVEKDGCLRQAPAQYRLENYELSIAGIGASGVLSKDGKLVKRASWEKSTRLTEEFNLLEASSVLKSLQLPLYSLRAEMVQHLHSQQALRLAHDRHNEAYTNLMVHAYMFLQTSAKRTKILREFFALPVSGLDLSQSITKGLLPPSLDTNLLIATKEWNRTFPSVQALRWSLDKLMSRDCAPADQKMGKPRTVTIIPKVNDDTRAEYTEDAYCKMWSDQIAVLKAGEGPISLLGTDYYVFDRGAFFIEEGLNALARLENERASRMRYTARMNP